MRVETKNSITGLIIKCSFKPSQELESETVEFKEITDFKAGVKDIAAEISAFSNKEGGVIILGIRDSANIKNGTWSEQLVGIKNIDILGLKEQLKCNIKPKKDFLLEIIEFHEKQFIAIHVPKAIHTLIATASGKYCIRDGKSSRPMEPNEIEDHVKSLQSYDWSADDLDVSIDDLLDAASLDEAYKTYCEKRYKDLVWPGKKSFLEAIGATKNGVLNKSGLLFLGRVDAIKEWLGIYEFRFSWKTPGGKLIINDIWEDNVWNSVKRAKNHFYKKRIFCRFPG